jgi:hypothetical protein
LLDRAWDERIGLFIYGGDSLLGDPARLIRLREWVLPESDTGWDVVQETISRVRRRVAWEPVRPGGRELWLVELFGDPLGDSSSPWPEDTRELIRAFLARGDSGRSMVLVLNRPRAPQGLSRGEAFGVVAGFMAPGQPTAELELEDVAPSLAALLGVPVPDGAQGIPRLDLMAPRDLAGAYVALQRGMPAAMYRHQELMKALGRPVQANPDFSTPERHAGEQAYAEAVATGLAAREALRGDLQRQGREIREAWSRGERREDFPFLYGLGMAAGVLLLLALVFGWSRGGWLAMLVAPVTGIPLIWWMYTWLESRPAGVWHALCQDPYQGVWMGVGVATAVLAPVVPLTWRGRLRLGGAVSLGCALGAVALALLSYHRYQHGVLDPWGLWSPQVLVERAWLGGVLMATPPVAFLLELFLGVVAWCEWRPKAPAQAAASAPAPAPVPAAPQVAPSPPPPRRAAGGA